MRLLNINWAAILIAAFCASVAINVMVMKRNVTLRERAEAFEDNFLLSQTQSQEYYDKLGRYVKEVSAYKLRSKDLEAMIKDTVKYKDSKIVLLANELKNTNIKLKNVMDAMLIGMGVSDTVYIPLKDTIVSGGEEFAIGSYESKHLKMDVMIYTSELENKYMTVSYSYNAELVYSKFKKKKTRANGKKYFILLRPFIGKEERIIVKSLDPNAKITELIFISNME